MVEDLDVSDSWKAKFKLLESVGAADKFVYKATSSVEFKALSFRERQKISLNLLAFIFGPLYYFSKKMWRKGAVLFGGITLLNVILTLIEMGVGAEFPPVVYWVPSAVICAQLANYDYYKFVVHNEVMWKPLNIFEKPFIASLFPVASFVLLAGTAFLPLSGSSTTCSSKDVTQLVTEIAGEVMEEQVGLKAAMLFSYDIDFIRTTGVNEKTGTQECAAELKLNHSEADDFSKLPITYTVEKTDDGEGIYVNVYGL
jgi:hypothetical protein